MHSAVHQPWRGGRKRQGPTPLRASVSTLTSTLIVRAMAKQVLDTVLCAAGAPTAFPVRPPSVCRPLAVLSVDKAFHSMLLPNSCHQARARTNYSVKTISWTSRIKVIAVASYWQIFYPSCMPRSMD